MRVQLVLDGDNAMQIIPVGSVEPAFLVAVEGARFDGARGCYVARLDKAIEIAKKLHGFRFSIDFGPAEKEAMLGKRQNKAAETASAEERASSIDARLRANGKALRGYQREGVRFLASRDRALLCDEMRLGKTLQVLAAIPDNPRLLVVCPKSVKPVWETEALFWRNDIFPTIHDGRSPVRWPRAGEMMVLSYEQMDEIPDAPPGVTIVADEAHVFKKKNSLRSKRFRALTRAAIDRGGRAWGLTATPLPDHALDIYNVLEAFELESEVFGNFGRFYRLFNAKRDDRGHTVWGDPEPEVHERLKRVMLRRRRAEVFPDLPPKQFTSIPVALPARLKKAANEFVQHMGGFEWLRGNILSDEGDPPAGAQGLRREIADAKIDAMMNVVKEYAEAKEPLVVFSAHTAPIIALGARPDYAVIHGQTSDAERRRAIDTFQAGKLAGIALSIRTGGVGIKLTHASTVLFVDREWTPALNWQAADRVVDVDDKNKRVTILSLVGDHPLDARVEEVVRIKETMFNAVVDGRTDD